MIQKLSAAGILKKEKKKIIVLDWDGLDDLSNGLRYE